ncbi:MAG TPA: peptidoglycan DD-metalloendopeptidase family protein [Tepidisphaeraceae bacterium]|nr:peptidoglycan DD-metalloendopeptidase family protein [Tepidisphaeraceae bacterium]
MQRRKTRPSKTNRHYGRSFVERLEDRILLANIHLIDAYLTDVDGNPLATVAVGQQAYIEIRFQTTDLPAAASYDVRTATGGSSYVNNINWGAGIAGAANYVYREGPHLIQDGGQTLSATLDVASAVAESDELDNSENSAYSGVTFGPGFDKMLEGDLWEDWSIGNYNDVDLTPETDDGGPFDGECDDYRGGNFCYDGHNGWDINIATWRQAYQGWEIYAAAGGTVVDMNDGEDDHNTEALNQPANYVTIDHGGGWSTTYVHLARNSVIVHVGDVVAAGDQVGLMGSSGNSTGEHLHWGVYYNGALVEPMVAAADNFNFTIGYTGDNPTVLGAGITTYNPQDELGEGPSDASIFITGVEQTVYTWAALAGIEPDDEVQQVWVRPNGKIEYTSPIQTGLGRGMYFRSVTIPDDAPAGSWNVRWMINGGEKKRAYFDVQNVGASQARIYRTDTTPDQYIVDGRSSALNFGTIMQSQTTAPTMSFRVYNSGQTNLTTAGLILPAGFHLYFGSSLAANIAPGASDAFTIEADIFTIGHKEGFVSFTTNDPSFGEAIQSFQIRADVLSPTNAVSTLLSNGNDAVYIRRENGFFNAQIWVNANNNPDPNWEIPISELDNFWINTLDGDDILTVDFRYGNPLHANGLNFNGGAGSEDQLSIWGSPDADLISLYDNAARLGSGRVDYFNTEQILLSGAEGDDTITIGGPIGTRDLDADTVDSVSVSGDGGNDTLILNDQDDTGSDSYFITNTTFTKSGFGLLEYNQYPLNHVESLILNANNGSDYIQIDSTDMGTPITINAGGGNDDIHLGAKQSVLDELKDQITVNGGPDSDHVYLWDTAHDPFETWHVGLATITSTRSGIHVPNFEMTYLEMELAEIEAGDGNAAFNIHDTYPTTPITINAGGGDDFFMVTPIGQNLGAITANLKLMGEAGKDSLSLDDRNYGPAPLTTNTLTEDTFTTSHAAAITFDSLAQILWQGSDDPSFFSIPSLPADVKVELDGRGGVDSFVLGNAAKGIADLKNATVEIDGGAVGGADSIGINDAANPDNDSHAITATTFDTDGFGLLTYSEIESFTLSAGSGNNVISIPSATANITIHAGAGNDTINLGAGNLNNITGNIAINGNGDTDRVIVDDSAYALLTTYTLNFPGVTRPGFGGLGYGTVEDVLLIASNVNSTINVNGTGATTNIILSPNDGADVINIIETHPNTPVTILPSNGGDTVFVNSDNAGFAQVLFTATTTLTALQCANNARATLSAGGGKVLRTNSLSLAPTATLDLADNAMIVQATALTRNAVAANVRNWIKSARNTNLALWTGPGLTSSLAALLPGSRAVGYMMNGAGGSNYATFEGQAVDLNSILVRYTVLGDLNLDKTVSISDFIDLSTHINSPGGWREGDVNYDDQVSISDFIDLTANFGQSLSGDAVPIPVQPMAAAAVELTTSDDVLENSPTPRKVKLNRGRRVVHHRHRRA